MANEFVLIKGYPGSGKTTAIVALIRLIVALGKTVLLTSYTHAAVDNVLVLSFEIH
jgi:DNA replication ATP-dependent helicase Dna2